VERNPCEQGLNIRESVFYSPAQIDLKIWAFLRYYMSMSIKAAHKRRFGSRIKINTSQKAQLALNIANKNTKKLSNSLQGEKKFIDNENAGFVVTDAGTIFLLNGVGVGDTSSTREGRRTLLKHIKFNFELVHDPLITTSNVRIILLKDSMNNGGGLPAILDILNSDDVSSQYTVNNIPQYTILWDRVFELSNVFKPCIVRTKKKKLKINVWHNNNGSGNDSIQKNAIFLLALSDVPVANNPPTMIYRNRFRFIDN